MHVSYALELHAVLVHVTCMSSSCMSHDVSANAIELHQYRFKTFWGPNSLNWAWAKLLIDEPWAYNLTLKL